MPRRVFMRRRFLRGGAIEAGEAGIERCMRYPVDRR
jgi:hypothetical protein